MSAPTRSPSQELTSMRKRAERAERQIALISRAAEMQQSDQPSQLAARLGAVRRLALPFSQPSTAPCAPVAVDPARAAAPPAGAGTPSREVRWQFHDGALVHLPALVAEAFGVSTSDARRSLAQGGVRVDGEVTGMGQLDIPIGDLDGAVLQLGKRRLVRVRISRRQTPAAERRADHLLDEGRGYLDDEEAS